jgi:hypothetical protein
MNSKPLNSKQARWAMLLAGFNLEIKHWLGKSNPANGPLRRPLRYSGEMLTTREDMLPSLQKTLQLEDRS